MQPLPVHYSYGLVAVSVLISILAAYAAFSLAERMRLAASYFAQRLWLLGGSVAMGAGIWSMHYLGMLAVMLPINVTYYVPTVVLSLLLAVGASAVALTIVSAEQMRWPQLVTGGVLMGAGIGSMHYVGMAAMRGSMMNRYTPGLVLLSVLVAVTASILALWVGFAFRSHHRHGESFRIIGGIVMGLGIAAMHYTAMAAVEFVPGSMGGDGTQWTVRVGSLGQAAVASVTGFMLLAAMVTAALEKRRYTRLRVSHEQLAQSQQELMVAQEQLREANALLSELSIRDGLTGLFNRRRFDEALDTEWRRATRSRTPLALLLIDIDHFKAINDNYGHQQGDDCLREIARVLENHPHRAHDVAARYGGEEFAVLLPNCNGNGAVRIADSIRAAVRALNIPNAGAASGTLTVSVGVCSRLPRGQESMEELVHDADTALYMAKELGRDRVEVAGRMPVSA